MYVSMYVCMREGIYPFGSKFIDCDPYTQRLKEAIHIRCHPSNINKYSGIHIFEAWIPTIKKHNRRSVTMWTYEETVSQSQNNNED